MIGHMDTKLGKIQVKHVPTLYKRWVLLGLEADPDYTLPKDESKDTIKQTVWTDHDGKSLVNELALDHIEKITEVNFKIQTADGAIMDVSPPRVPRDPALYQTFYEGLNTVIPHVDKIKDSIALLQQSPADWKANRPLPNNRDKAKALSDIGLRIAPGYFSTQSLRSAFEECMREYTIQDRAHLESLLHVGPPPAGDHGFGAQVVQSHDVTVSTKLPLADSDLTLGFMFSPAKHFEICPRFIGYSRRRKDEVVANFASQDAKPIAI